MKPQNTARLACCAATFLCAAAPCAQGDGGIMTDGTVGPLKTLGGAAVEIPQSLGKTVGANLFHSFERFNIDPGQSVTFQENAPNTLDNVISRVTGGSASAINGALAVTPEGHANFYLVNPAGVLFGAGASINVPGDFHVSTADEIRFKDGGNYSAAQPATSTLSAAAPAAFGFTGGSASNNSLLKLDGAALTVNPGKTIDLVGGAVSLENGASLTAQAGEVRLVARQGAGEVGLARDANGALPLPADAPNAGSAGDVTIQDGTVDTSGNGGGRVGVWGGDVEISGSSSVSANNTGVNPARPEGGAEISGNSFLLDGGTISTYTNGPGKAGYVAIKSENDLIIKNNATINSASDDMGAGGTVALDVGNDLNVDNSTIDVTANGGGNAGSVSIRAGDNVAFQNWTSITSTSTGSGQAGTVSVAVGKNMALKDNAALSSAAYSAGNAGRVDIQVAGNMSMIRGGIISTETRDAGNAGTVSVKSGGNVLIVGQVSDYSEGHQPTAILSNAGDSSSGNAGTVRIGAAGSVSLQDGGGVSTNTAGPGYAGKVSINSGGPVSILNGGVISSDTSAQGDGGSVILTTGGQISIDGAGSAIKAVAEAGSTGLGGTVQVSADADMAVRGGGVVSSATAGTGNAGTVTVKTGGMLTLEGVGTAIGSSAEPGSLGNVGHMEINAAGDVTIRNGAVITGSTGAPGQAGAVILATHGNLVIDGQGYGGFTGIASEAGAKSLGNASDIRADVAGNVAILNGGALSSDTYSQGQGGNVSVNANNIRLDHGSISAKAGPYSTGSTGQVEVAARNTLALDQASISVANQGRAATPGTAHSGGLKVSAQDIELAGNSQITTQSTGNVPAGPIAADFSGQLRLANSAISTSAHGGDGGAITIRGGGLVDLCNAKITTSVTGTANGNGGDIAMSGDNLILQSGAITADTAASARGGNIALNLKGVVADGDNLIVGGDRIIDGRPGIPGWNVIRAAAPGGVDGLIQSTTPQLNLSGALLGFGGTQFRPAGLDGNYCARSRRSSLTRKDASGLFTSDGSLLDY